MASKRDYDREICLCFHVSLGKIAKFVRLRRPQYASETAHCYGAGTGCGWCVPFLEKIHAQVMAGEAPTPDISPEEYRRRRDAYRKSLGLKPGELEIPPPEDGGLDGGDDEELELIDPE